MFVACGIWCLADVSSVSPSSVRVGMSRVSGNTRKFVLKMSFILFSRLFSLIFRLQDGKNVA